ncbi:hypothetical protein SK355_02675 [Candidatus Fukatsuia symbiotica]|nr:hypothetical protein [Candidatus Fukatsuia symbiotica]MEA9444236.1 hypothetical protein [Candidatus Fukatsuia symbiotica]
MTKDKNNVQRKIIALFAYCSGKILFPEHYASADNKSSSYFTFFIVC